MFVAMRISGKMMLVRFARCGQLSHCVCFMLREMNVEDLMVHVQCFRKTFRMTIAWSAEKVSAS